MEIAYQVFLYTVEEKSITGGAARAKVSQQCASQHIRNLERRLGTTLLCRHPFALTEAGKRLAEGLQHLAIEERQMQNAVEEIVSGERGIIRIGCNATRARLLFPNLLVKYREVYPHIKFSFFFGDTVELINRLYTGKLDLVIGVNLKPKSQLKRIPLVEEKIFFACRLDVVTHWLPQKNREKELSLSEISKIPFCRNLPESTMTQLLQWQASKENVVLNPDYVCSDYQYQVELCLAGLCGCFLPETLLPLLKEKKIDVWNLLGVEERLHIDLIYPVVSIQPQYEKALIQMIRQEYLSKSVSL